MVSRTWPSLRVTVLPPRALEGVLHSVRATHSRLIRPTEWSAVDGVIHLH